MVEEEDVEAHTKRTMNMEIEKDEGMDGVDIPVDAINLKTTMAETNPSDTSGAEQGSQMEVEPPKVCFKFWHQIIFKLAMQEKKSIIHQLNACRKMQRKKRPRERIFNFRKVLLEVFVTVSWRRLLKRNMRWLCKTESWRKQRIRRMRWSRMFMICETRYLQNKLD